MKIIARSILLSMLLSLNNLSIEAQDFTAVLESIESHSIRLKSARQEAEAQKEDARADAAWDNPEVGFNYLFGRDGIGNRWDLNVSQNIDFPSVIAQKRRMVRELNRVSDLHYLTERQQVLLAARKLCIEVVYCNAMMDHLNEDLEMTQALVQAYETLFKQGEATIIDHNKAHQTQMFFQAEYREFLSMKENLLDELCYLNGGVNVEIKDSVFESAVLPADFDAWLESQIDLHPALQLAAGEVASNEQSLRLAKHRRMPNLKVGYMGEFAREDKYQGPTVGLSLPLWGSQRQVRSARLHLEAAETSLQDVRMQLMVHLRGVYRDALQLQKTCHEYDTHLHVCDNSELLQKSLRAGQITLLTYLDECQYVHEMHVKYLAAQRDLALRLAELKF